MRPKLQEGQDRIVPQDPWGNRWSGWGILRWVLVGLGRPRDDIWQVWRALHIQKRMETTTWCQNQIRHITFYIPL